MAVSAFTPSNSDLILANELNLWLVRPGTGGTSSDEVVGYATSVQVSISSDSIDTSNKMSPRWAMFLAGSSSYEVSAEALYTRNDKVIGYDYLMEQMVAGNTVKWKIGTKVKKEGDYNLDMSKGVPHYEGDAVITSLSLSAGNNEVASCSITLTGSGAIKLVEGTQS